MQRYIFILNKQFTLTEKRMLLQKRIYIYIAIVRFTIYNIRADLWGAERIFPTFSSPIQ